MSPAILMGVVAYAGIPSINPEPAADYTITSDAEWTTVFSNSDAILSGKVIEIAAGTVLTSKSLVGRNFSSVVTIRGASYSQGAKSPNKPILTGDATNGSLWVNNTSNVRFKYLDFYQPTNGVSIFRAGDLGASNISIWGCELRGTPFDPNGNWSAGAPPTANYAVQGGAAPFNGISIRDCYIHDCLQGPRPLVQGGVAEMVGNLFDNVFGDVAAFAPSSTNPPSIIRFNWNFASRTSAVASDANNPHSDFFQITAGTSEYLIEILGNVFAVLNARGRPQGIFIQPLVKGEIAYNICLTPNAGSTTVRTSSSVKELYFHDNVGLNETPGISPDVATVFASSSSSAAVTDVSVRGNYSEGFVIPTVADQANNLVVPRTLAGYQAAGFGPSFPPTTVDEVIAKYGSVLTRANYATRTIDRTGEHPGMFFPSQFSRALGSVSTSAYTKVKGGPDLQVFSVPAGLEMQYADDPSFTTNVMPSASTWYTGTSGTIPRGKFVRVRQTNSGLNATTVTGNLVVNGFTIPFQTTTVSTPYLRVSFNAGGGTGSFLTKTGTLANTSNSSKFTVAFGIGANGRPAANRNIFAAVNSRVLIVHLATGPIRFTLRDPSGVIVLGSFDIPMGNWENGSENVVIVSADLTKDTAAEGLTVLVNGNQVTVTPTTWSKNALIAWADNTNWVFPNTSYDVNVSFFYLNVGTALDLTLPANVNLFSSDFIGANGSGPTGSQPQVCIKGNAAKYIAGNANDGNGGTFVLTGTVTNV